VRFPGGEGPGLARLAAWTGTRLARYKTTRNGLLDPDDATRLSPWLAHGCVSPRAVYEAVLGYERQSGRTEETYWLVLELLWRDFFRFVAAKHGDRLFHAAGLQGARVPFRSLRYNDEGAREDFERWRLGRTGVPLVDAAMRELLATGYTSNRTRQNVASFLVKNLGVDWRAGAEWYESAVIDYDVASNWGNWAYVAGVGNDARGFRFFDVYKQAEAYDPEGAYVRHWLPELAGVSGARVHRPERLSAEERARAGLVLGRDYPEPMVDLLESAARQEQLWARAAGRSPGQGGGRGDRRLEGRSGRDARGRDGRARRR
jgi:deoxyribodipyrimidine photo-lyase